MAKITNVSWIALLGIPGILFTILLMIHSNEMYECNAKHERIATIIKDCSMVGNPAVPPNSPELLKYIRKYHLTPPPKKLIKSRKRGSKKERVSFTSKYRKDIMKIFKKKRNGFFIEAEAGVGGPSSNTFQLERNYNWTGVLIEPNPYMLVKLRLANRRAWIAGVCIALRGYPEKVRFMHRVGQEETKFKHKRRFTRSKSVTTIAEWSNGTSNEYVYAGQVECIPLYSILLSLKRTVVDYFSLDAAGTELQVLKSIPFDRVTIKVFSIDYKLIPEGVVALQSFLTSKKYIIMFKKYGTMFAVHKDFIHEFGLRLKFGRRIG